jgi:hypothetical protein
MFIGVFGLRLIGSSHLFAGDVEILEPAGVRRARKMFNCYLLPFAMFVAYHKHNLDCVTAVRKQDPRSRNSVLGQFLKPLFRRLYIV